MFSITELESFLKPFNCVEGLLEIGKLSRKLFSENKFHDDLPMRFNDRSEPQTVTQWGLAHLAYRLILVSNDGRRRKLDWDNLMQAHYVFNELDDPFLHDKDELAYLLRTSQEQFWWQELNLPMLWTRYKSIFSFDNFFTKNFYKVSNLTIEEYLLIGISILGYVNLGLITPAFSIDKLMSSSIPSPFKESLTERNIANFFNLASGNYGDIRREARTINKVTIPNYDRFGFNALFKYPIVQGDRRFSYYSSFQYVIPNLALLMKKIAQGIYWDLRDEFAKIPSQEFVNKFGEAFESYCGDVLKNHWGEQNVQSVKDILGEKYEETIISDWVISDDKMVYIFECKSALLPAIVRQTFIWSVANRWIIRNIIKAVKQLENTEKILRNVGFLEKQKVYKLVLLLEDLYFAEHPTFKRRVLERLISKKILTSIQIYFVTISELEKMEEAIQKHGFSRVLEKKREIDDSNDPSLGRDFVSVCKDLDSHLTMKSEFLSRIFKETFSDWKIFK